MMERTHILVGISSLWLLAWIPNVVTPDTLGSLTVCAALGALLPDLDANNSTIKHLSVARIQPFAPVACVLSRDLGHRGATHSLLGLGIFAVLTLPLVWFWPWGYWAALVLCYTSHLVADACTKSGIPFLYPNRKKVHLLPRAWRLTTGSLAEDALVPIIALAILFLLFSQLRQLQEMPLPPQL